MGDFLSTPDKTKESFDNENEFLRFGSCGMQGWRKRMEDAHISDISQGDQKQYQIFGVFDGHGGKEVSQFVKAHFTKEFLNNQNLKKGDVQKALTETFFKMDDLMREAQGKIELREFAKKSKEEDDIQNAKNPNQNAQNELISKLLSQQKGENEEVALMTGCTACVCVIDTLKKKLYFANAGDSRVVLCKKGQAYPMSLDHKPENEIEKNRIYKADGWISEGRVKGNLNLSRGLGDLEYKQNTKLPPEEQMITANPDIKIEELDKDCDFIVLGCDGIWDCLTNQEACDYVKNDLKISGENTKLSGILEKMLDSICATDIYNETGVGCDNMTCLIVQFKK